MARTGGAVTSGAQKLVAAAGTRDVAYKVGKTFGHKFKPWGCSKGGTDRRSGRRCSQAAAVAWDIVSWIRTEQKEIVGTRPWIPPSNRWKRPVHSKLRSGSTTVLLPFSLVGARLTALRDDHIAEQKQAEDRVVRAEQRLDSITLLVNAFEDLWKDDT